METYPVYNSNGRFRGNYAWRDITRLFKDEWVLEKGVFHLKPLDGEALVDREEPKDSPGQSDRPPAQDQPPSENEVVRVEDTAGNLVGYFPLAQVKDIVGPYAIHNDSTCVSEREVKATQRKALLKRSLRQSSKAPERLEELTSEIDSIGVKYRVLMRNGMLVGFYTKAEVERKWSVRSLHDGNLIINETLPKDERMTLLRQQLELRGRLNHNQATEIEKTLGKGLVSDEEVNQKPLGGEWRATDREATPEKRPEDEKREHRTVYDLRGTKLGVVKLSGIEKRLDSWDPDFFALGERSLVIRAEISRRPTDVSSLWTAIDEAHREYTVSHGYLTIEKMIEDDRRGKRARIVMACLEGRGEECRDYVIALMLPEEADVVKGIVEREVGSHPGLYTTVESFEHIKLKTIALANVYDRERSEKTEDLLARAHLFDFDDEAWWEARACPDALDHLPYPVCLVEDVLIWDVGHGIRSLALSPSADEGASRRMLSFIVNRCSSRKLRDGTVAFSKTMDALPGAIAVSSLRSGTLPTVQRGAKTSSKQGRSPRRHTRRGHWRNQAYGPGMKLHKRIWISDTVVGPSGKAYKITEPTRIHFVSLSKANER